MMLSVIPSHRYSVSGSLLALVKGRTAIESMACDEDAAASAVFAVSDDDAIHANSAFRSRADCQRSSGSFARQRCSNRSRAAVATEETEGTGRSRIAAIIVACDVPPNAR